MDNEMRFIYCQITSQYCKKGDVFILDLDNETITFDNPTVIKGLKNILNELIKKKEIRVINENEYLYHRGIRETKN